MTSIDTAHEAPAGGDGASELDALDEFSEKLDAFKAFSSNDREAADKLFESLGGGGKVEPEMLLQLGAWLPQRVTRFVVRDHVKNVVKSIGHLYPRTSAPKESADAAMLRRAWFQVEKVTPGYGGSAFGLPTFLAGGAFASSLTALDQPLTILYDVVGAAGNPPRQVVSFALISLIVMGLAAVAVPAVVAIVFFTS